MDFSVQVTFTDQKFGGVTIKVKGTAFSYQDGNVSFRGHLNQPIDNWKIIGSLLFFNFAIKSSKNARKGLGDVGHYDILIQNDGENPIPVSVTVNSFPRDDAFPVKMSTHAIDRQTGEVTIFAELYQVLAFIHNNSESGGTFIIYI